MSGESNSQNKSVPDTNLLPFLSKDARPDLKAIAIEHFKGFAEDTKFLDTHPDYIIAVADLCQDSNNQIAKDAVTALVNVTNDVGRCSKLLHLENNPNFVLNLLKNVVDSDCSQVEQVCMLLSNLSRPENCAKMIYEVISKNKDQVGFDKIIQAFCMENYNKNGPLHYLGAFLCNLSQIIEVRHCIMDQHRCVIQRLLPFTQYQASKVRRRGVVGTLRNCCFETDYHDWLLSDQVDILPALLLPLAGPEEFDEEDNEKLPEDLQYLEPSKTREESPEIRKMLIEAMNQLCAKKSGRTYLRDKNAYVIMRELDKWEEDEAVQKALLALVDILIGDEPAPEHENLKEVEIPEDLQKKFLEKNQKLEELMKSE